MTSQPKTAILSDLNLRASELFDLLRQIHEAGFKVVVTDGWKLDLLDPETGAQEPVWALGEAESA